MARVLYDRADLTDRVCLRGGTRMARFPRTLTLALTAALILGYGLPAPASVPKVIFGEGFGATW